ncbi:MAG: DUF5654 family protein [Patescibacteria group bacterium]
MEPNIKREEEITTTAEDFIEKYGIYKLHYTLFEKFKFILLTGLALITALAWDEGMKHVFHEYLTPIDTSLGMILYAVCLTVITLVAATVLKKKK